MTAPKKPPRPAGATVLSLHGPDRQRAEAAERWLLRAAPDETAARAEWDQGVAVLVAGRAWDVVRVPCEVLDPAFGRDTEPDTLRACLARLRLVGPSFCDPYRPFLYFLVPVGTDRTWPREALSAARVECLGGSASVRHHVGVPRINRTARPGLFWLVPPDRVPFRHVDAEHLRAVLCERVAACTDAAPGAVL